MQFDLLRKMNRTFLKSLKLNQLLPNNPKGNYKSIQTVGNILYTSGHIPIDQNGNPIQGKLSPSSDLQDTQLYSQIACKYLLKTLEDEIGDLNRITKIVKLTGFCNATDDFTKHPAVINGASDLLVELFGTEIGMHARSAVGCSSLPLGSIVELELVAEFK